MAAPPPPKRMDGGCECTCFSCRFRVRTAVGGVRVRPRSRLGRLADGRGLSAFGVHHERRKSREEGGKEGERGPFPGCNLPPPLSFSLNDFREGTHDEKYHPIINSAYPREQKFRSPPLHTFEFRGNIERRGEGSYIAILRPLQAPPTVISSNIKSLRPGLPLAESLPPSPLASPRYKAAAAATPGGML